MLAIEYSTREFFNMLITFQWAWLLATIIVIGKMLVASRLESRSHVSRNAQLETRNPKRATRTAQHGTRNTKLCT
jgi:hypothetical protein